MGVDIVESLDGGDIACGDIATYLTRIAVDDLADPNQTIELMYTFATPVAGPSGVAWTDVVNMQVNAGVVSSGDGIGGTDAGHSDPGGNAGATLTFESR